MAAVITDGMPWPGCRLIKRKLNPTAARRRQKSCPQNSESINFRNGGGVDHQLHKTTLQSNPPIRAATARAHIVVIIIIAVAVVDCYRHFESRPPLPSPSISTAASGRFRTLEPCRSRSMTTTPLYRGRTVLARLLPDLRLLVGRRIRIRRTEGRRVRWLFDVMAWFCMEERSSWLMLRHRHCVPSTAPQSIPVCSIVAV